MAGAPEGYKVFTGPIQSRSDLFKQDFDREIDGHGERATWEQACPCPCSFNDQTDQPNPLCPSCGGTAWQYYGAREVFVIVDRYGLTQDGLQRMGQLWTGEVQLTARLETPLGYRHRVSMLESTVEYLERTERLPGDRQWLRMPIASRDVEYWHVATQTKVTLSQRVNRMIWNKADGIVELRDGVDFDVTDAGQIDWRKGDRLGTAPTEGATFGVSYFIRPRFIVTSLTPYGIRGSRTLLGYTQPHFTMFPGTVSAKLDLYWEQARENLALKQ